MSRIYKYETPIGERVDIPMHPGKILHAQVKNADITVWADVEPSLEPRHRTFQVVGTGGEPPHNGGYLSTTIDPPFVWHLYDITGGTT